MCLGLGHLSQTLSGFNLCIMTLRTQARCWPDVLRKKLQEIFRTTKNSTQIRTQRIRRGRTQKPKPLKQVQEQRGRPEWCRRIVTIQPQKRRMGKTHQGQGEKRPNGSYGGTSLRSVRQVAGHKPVRRPQSHLERHLLLLLRKQPPAPDPSPG